MLESLTSKQNTEIIEILAYTRKNLVWSWDLPIFIRERCWLRLTKTSLNELNTIVPTNILEDAPELKRYQELVQWGYDSLIAQQYCWLEYGQENCQRAQKMLWNNYINDEYHGWNLRSYLSLISKYKHLIKAGIATVPMLTLARCDSSEPHHLNWITQKSP